MDNVRDIMNDIYLTYKQYKLSGDLKQWNYAMAGFRRKYPDNPFYDDLSWTFIKQVVREREKEKK